MESSEFHDSINSFTESMDPSALNDELLLTKILPQGSIETRLLLAGALLARFRSFGLVLNASNEQLLKVPGVDGKTLNSIKLHQATANRIVTSHPADTVYMMEKDSVIAYLGPLLSNRPIEYFYTLYLNSAGFLLQGEETSKGTVSSTRAYPREIVKRALELEASMVVVAHNHPSGLPEPSLSDIESTKDIARACDAVGIKLRDHIIIGHPQVYCFSSSEYSTALNAKAIDNY